MIIKLKKIIYFVLIFSICFIAKNYCNDIDISINYGIDNVAKNGNNLPLQVALSNKNSNSFNGQMKINVFETNMSLYTYANDISISGLEEIVFIKNIAITNKTNTIIIEIYNEKLELVNSERVNIDLSYYDDRLIVGIMSSDYNAFSYMDDLLISSLGFRIKLVEINEESFINNKNVLDVIDLLIISDINSNEFNDSINFAINNYINNGKHLIVGLGGKKGIYTMPTFLYSHLNGPAFDVTANIGFGRILNCTQFDLTDGKKIINYNDRLSTQILNLGSSQIIFTPFSFVDLENINNNKQILKDIFEKGIAPIFFSNNNFNSEDYFKMTNLISIIDKDRLPDLFLLTLLLVLYISTSSVLLYVYLRNVSKKYLYGKYVVVIALIFTFIMFIFGYGTKNKNTFMNYISIVELDDTRTKEKSLMDFRRSEKGSFSFNTSANIKFYPIVEPNVEPILSSNFINLSQLKTTTFFEDNNRIYVDVNNSKHFDSNFFVYENSNYIDKVYDITGSISRYNGVVDGRITNNMNYPITNANILLSGKVLKLGNIDANHSVSLVRAENYGVPIRNNSMISEIMDKGNDASIIKYYLDNLKGYNDALFFGFIENNDSIDVVSNDVGDIYGKTLLIKKMNIINVDNLCDISSLDYPVFNSSGGYDAIYNLIDGDREVINEYTFDEKVSINSIYFENISNYDFGNLDFNVPFYGNKYIYNIENDSFDLYNEKEISKDKLKEYLTKDNKITIKFSPLSKDPLYRKISLPILRATGVK